MLNCYECGISPRTTRAVLWSQGVLSWFQTAAYSTPQHQWSWQFGKCCYLSLRFLFFVVSFLYALFFAKVAYVVGLSAKSLAHQSKAKKMGHFFLSWREKPQQYSGSNFFTRAFSKFSPELQLLLYTGCQAAGNGQTWALGIKIKVMDKSKPERFLLWPFPEWIFSGAIPWMRTKSLSWWLWWMGRQLGCWGWRERLQLCFSPAHLVLHCKTSKTGLLPPLLPRQTTAAWLAVHDSRAGGVQQLGASQAG